MFRFATRVSRSHWRVAGGVLAVGTAGGVAAYELDEGVQRSVVCITLATVNSHEVTLFLISIPKQTFWYNIVPIYARYRFVQFLNEDLKYINDDEAMRRYDAIHDKYTDFVRDITYKMRGFYLKHVSRKD
jgi:hypothetical protein